MGRCTSPMAYSRLAIGERAFTVGATDAAGNISLGAIHAGELGAPDTTAPETVIVNGPSAKTTDTAAEIHFEGTDGTTGSANLTFTCRLDGAAWQLGCSNPQTWSGLALGGHTFEVYSTDQAGNVD